jgi:hypothetical protein
MKSTIRFLQGKKTYLIVAVLAVLYVLEAFVGIDIPGVDVTQADVLEHLGIALGLGTIRAGIAKAN